MKKTLLILVAILWSVGSIATNLQARFSSQQSESEIYYNGFDSYDDFDLWDLGNTNWYYTWDIYTRPRNGAPAFSTINPSSQYSLGIYYNDSRLLDETMTSPSIAIPANAKCSFYTSYHGAFAIFANITLDIIVDDEVTEIFNGFTWSNDYDYTNKNWMKMSIDLTAYAHKEAKFRFRYNGQRGDDVYIDDFKITASDDSDNSKITINEGESVNYIDMSEGNPTEWLWEFPGGTPATSTEQNPVVLYKEAGVYSSKLTVKSGAETSTYTRTDFVTVIGVAPKAKIGFPESAYLSPFALAYFPANVELQFTDLSEGNPTAWEWKIPGSTTPTTTEQHPKVTYENEGLFGISLKSINKTGNDSDEYVDAIQVGGEQYIWNITPEENSQLRQIALSWYGNYGGSNWLDIYSFAESFHKPAKEGLISEVDIYFASVSTVTPDAEITVSVNKSVDGLPGDALATAIVLAKDLKYSETTYLPTTFVFDSPVLINEDFFIVIAGIPNNTNESYVDDDIAMFCSPKRSATSKGTTYNYQAELDDYYQPTGNASWVKNDDDPVSFAVAPKLKYTTSTSIGMIEATEITANAIVVSGKLLIETNGKIEQVSIYNLSGQAVKNATDAIIGLDDLPSGVYIVRMNVSGVIYNQKIMK